MQNKTAIIILAIALALVSIYQLSFTGATSKVRQDAKKYAQGDLVKQTYYLDSISSLPKEDWSFLGYTFKEVQKRELNLGLDLKGGMNVILEVSVEDILKALSNYSTDKTFTSAIARAKELSKESQADFLTLFGRAFQEIDPNAKMAAVFNTVDLRDKINFNSSNEDVLDVLDDEVTTSITNAFNILRTRIDRFGVVQPNITQLATKGRILIELPGQTDPQRVRESLQGTANLEFWETYENGEVISYLVAANDLLKNIEDNARQAAVSESQQTDTVKTEADTVKKEDQALLDLIEKDTTQAATAATREEFALQNPLFGVLTPSVTENGEALPSCMI